VIPKIEAVFVSCTSLKCAPIIARAEARFGVPILSSNSAIAWDMARLAQVSILATGKGTLFLK
jgi:maleate isomerase